MMPQPPIGAEGVVRIPVTPDSAARTRPFVEYFTRYDFKLAPGAGFVFTLEMHKMEVELNAGVSCLVVGDLMLVFFSCPQVRASVSS
jgi:hypothetical protein